MSTRHLFIVRHGQRKDHLPVEYPEFKNHPDSPLTPLGWQQAQETGNFLKKIVAEFGCERVRIGCSPFWRCLETSSAIAKALEVKNVTLEYEFGEVLLDYLYKENPVPHLKTN